MKTKIETIQLDEKTGTIKSFSTRRASNKGKGLTIVCPETGKKDRENLHFSDWETLSDRVLTASVSTSLKNETVGNLLSFVATKDIKAGQEVLAFCLVGVGETETARVQDDIFAMKRGSLNASTLVARERASFLAKAESQARVFKAFPANLQIPAIMAELECSEAIATEAVANVQAKIAADKEKA